MRQNGCSARSRKERLHHTTSLSGAAYPDVNKDKEEKINRGTGNKSGSGLSTLAIATTWASLRTYSHTFSLSFPTSIDMASSDPLDSLSTLLPKHPGTPKPPPSLAYSSLSHDSPYKCYPRYRYSRQCTIDLFILESPCSCESRPVQVLRVSPLAQSIWRIFL